MSIALLLSIALMQSSADVMFSVRSELQSLYDEISQATLQFETPADVDDFHDIMYAPDWVFVDEKGQTHGWSDMRQREVDALPAQSGETINQAIRKLSIVPGGATADVKLTIVRQAGE